MIHLVTFATDDMSMAAELCISSSKQHGVQTHSRCNYGNVMHDYSLRTYWKVLDHLFTNQRGAGFWAWKPAIIKSAFEIAAPGDVVIYADAGVEFVNNVNYIIDRMYQDIFLFGNNWEHAHWCKADVAKQVWPEWCTHGGGGCHCPNGFWERFGKQVQASVIFFRVSDYTRKFVKEWLDWCLFEGGRLIDDSPSRTPNHPEFQENRHDQAILTTLACREGIKLHWWPASYNDGQFVYDKINDYATDNYPVMFNHHRKRNNQFQQLS